jgi:hypothetical protein
MALVIDFSLEHGITRPVISKFSSTLGVTSAAHPIAWLSQMMRTLFSSHLGPNFLDFSLQFNFQFLSQCGVRWLVEVI